MSQATITFLRPDSTDGKALVEISLKSTVLGFLIYWSHARTRGTSRTNTYLFPGIATRLALPQVQLPALLAALLAVAVAIRGIVVLVTTPRGQLGGLHGARRARLSAITVSQSWVDGIRVDGIRPHNFGAEISKRSQTKGGRMDGRLG